MPGVTAIDCSTPAVTVRVVLLETEPTLAVITEVPAETAVPRPELPTTVATAVVPDDHATVEVMSVEVPSE